jgi:hypothetical protein
MTSHHQADEAGERALGAARLHRDGLRQPPDGVGRENRTSQAGLGFSFLSFLAGAAASDTGPGPRP